jgi:hypothetical protein
MNLCKTCKPFSLILLGGGGLYPTGVYHLTRKNPHLTNARDLLTSAEQCQLCSFLKDLILSAVEREAENKKLLDIKDWLAPDPIYVSPCNDPPRSPNAFSKDEEYLTGFTLEVPVVEGGPKLSVLDLEADVFAYEGTWSFLDYNLGVYSYGILNRSNIVQIAQLQRRWISVLDLLCHHQAVPKHSRH